VKTLIITGFELKRVVQKKWFIISTILTPVFIILYAAFPVLIGALSQKERTLGMIDKTGIVIQEFQKEYSNSTLEKKQKKGKFNFDEKSIKIKIQSLKNIDEGKSLIASKKLDGILIIEDDFFKTRKATLYMRNVADTVFQTMVRTRLNRITELYLLKKLNLEENILEEILKGTNLKILKVEKER